MKPARSLNPCVIYPEGPWEHRNISAGGMRFHVVTLGKPQPEQPSLLLLHGFPQFWRAWIPVIEQLHSSGKIPHIIAADLRGCGGSDKQPHGYRLRELAADCIALLTACGASSAVVIGHGVGAQIGWMMAHENTDNAAVVAIATENATNHNLKQHLVRGLIAVASPHPLEIARLFGFISPTVIAGHIAAKLPFISIKAAQNGTLIRALIKRWAASANVERLLTNCHHYCAALTMPQAAHGAMAHAQRTYRFDIVTKRLLKRPVNIPVVVVRGACDPVFRDRAYSRDAQHSTIGVQTIVIPECGHFVPEEAPLKLASIIENTYEATKAS